MSLERRTWRIAWWVPAAELVGLLIVTLIALNGGWTASSVTVVLFVGAAFLVSILHNLWLRVTVSQDGIAYRSLLHHTHFRFDELERVVRGNFHALSFFDRHGRQLNIVKALGRPDDILAAVERGCKAYGRELQVFDTRGRW